LPVSGSSFVPHVESRDMKIIIKKAISDFFMGVLLKYYLLMPSGTITVTSLLER
jgi:hypothetical protein